jgi:hypothetical protein
MKVFMLLFALTMPVDALAVDRSRCGTDPFGNVVCMDKDGVLFNVSRDILNGEDADSASGVSDAEKKRREEIREKIRCGIDPFGNKVCR